jgi:hypothetical protein
MDYYKKYIKYKLKYLELQIKLNGGGPDSDVKKEELMKKIKQAYNDLISKVNAAQFTDTLKTKIKDKIRTGEIKIDVIRDKDEDVIKSGNANDTIDDIILYTTGNDKILGMTPLRFGLDQEECRSPKIIIKPQKCKKNKKDIKDHFIKIRNVLKIGQSTEGHPIYNNDLAYDIALYFDKQQIENIEKLINSNQFSDVKYTKGKITFTDFSLAYDIASHPNLTITEINNIIKLKEAGFKEKNELLFLYKHEKDIDNIIALKKLNANYLLISRALNKKLDLKVIIDNIQK